MLMPHFGSWPQWFPIYLETCRRNPGVDWLFITDCETPDGAPANVRFKTATLEGVQQLASERLNQEIALPHAFKICDLRPAFAVIFDEEIRGYDFWGWGDTDLFYGSFADCLSEAALARYDVISSRSGFLSGEFTLLRNTPDINRLYSESADYERIFSSSSCFNFSEYGFFKDRPIDSITHVVKRNHRSGRLRCLLDDLGRNDRKLGDREFRFYWHAGRLSDLDTGEPILLYHFLDLKRESSFVIPESPLDYSNGFLVTRAGVQPAESAITVQRRPVRAVVERTRRLARRLRTNR